jgi:hypothetical protein
VTVRGGALPPRDVVVGHGTKNVHLAIVEEPESEPAGIG